MRRGIREQLARWGTSELADDATLIASELLGNAIRHGTPPVGLTLDLHGAPGDRRRLWIGVTDAGQAFDIALVQARWRHPSAPLGTGGRGLRLVDALSRDWGDRPRRRGHTVWAELDCGTRS
ncbi:ATP-binding protein [Streptomyces sp. NPDC087903]|uniref:ATP-binding protein n=1 Tax=Streptomyces sp. NPDC087903 TaxID=3365819 RepID=UPI0037FE357A